MEPTLLKPHKILPLLAVLALLIAQIACSLSGQSPLTSDSEMATRVQAALTNMAATAAVATRALPTLGPPVTPSATASPSPIPDTPTTAPTETPTITNTPEIVDTATATETPTPSETPLPSETSTPLEFTATAQKPTFSIDYRDPLSYLGEATYTDEMIKGDNWNQETDSFTAVAFEDYNTMRLLSLSEAFGWRIAPASFFINGYIEMTDITSDCSGSDTHGLFFRSSELNNADQGYLFGITCKGKYVLMEWDGRAEDGGHMTTLIPWTASGNIKTGEKMENRIGVMLVNNRIILYVNGHALAEISDNTYPSGYFGVMIAARHTPAFTVNVDIIRAWKDAVPKQ